MGLPSCPAPFVTVLTPVVLQGSSAGPFTVGLSDAQGRISSIHLRVGVH